MAYNNTSDLFFNKNESCTQITREQFQMADTTSWVLEGIAQLILTFIGLLANLLSIFILTRKTLASKTFNQLLTALATLDSIFLLIMLYESIGRCFEIEGWDHVHTFLLPYFLYPVKAIAMTGSVYMMLSVAVERYIAVYHPFTRIPSSLQSSSRPGRRLSTRLIVYLLPVILFAIVFNVPKFFESKYDPAEEPYIFITELRTDATYLVLNSWARLLFLGIIPVVVISILNYKIFRAIRRSQRTSGRQGDDTLSIVLFFIVVIFLICSIPRLIILMFEVTILDEIRYCTKEKMNPFPFWNMMLGIFSHVLLVINPFLNFIVYCVIGKTFRLVAGQYLRKLSGKLSPCLSAYLPRSPAPQFRDGGVRNTWSYIGPQDGGHMSGFFKANRTEGGQSRECSFRRTFLEARPSLRNNSTRTFLSAKPSLRNNVTRQSSTKNSRDKFEVTIKDKFEVPIKDKFEVTIKDKFEVPIKDRFGGNFLSAHTRQSFDQNLAAKVLNGNCGQKNDMLKSAAIIELVQRDRIEREKTEVDCIVMEGKRYGQNDSNVLKNYNENDLYEKSDSYEKESKKTNHLKKKDSVKVTFKELDSIDSISRKKEVDDSDLAEEISEEQAATDSPEKGQASKNSPTKGVITTDRSVEGQVPIGSPTKDVIGNDRSVKGQAPIGSPTKDVIGNDRSVEGQASIDSSVEGQASIVSPVNRLAGIDNSVDNLVTIDSLVEGKSAVVSLVEGKTPIANSEEGRIKREENDCINEDKEGGNDKSEPDAVCNNEVVVLVD